MNKLSIAVPVKSHKRNVNLEASLPRVVLRLNLIDFILLWEIYPSLCRTKQEDRERYHHGKCDPRQRTGITQISLLKHDVINIAFHRGKTEIQNVTAIQKDSATECTGQ